MRLLNLGLNLWQTLRWRLIAAQMLVVLVGVVVLALAAQALVLNPLPGEINAILNPLSQSDNAGEVTAAGLKVVETVRGDVFLALAVAAVAAAVAGLAAIAILIREILRPLRAIAKSSARIAHGHYGERVGVPPAQEMAEVAINFNHMAHSLEEVEAQRVMLLANVAHELRTPLTGLRGYVEGLQDGLFQSDADTLALMEGEIRRMQRLVDDIHALSQVEAGQIDLMPQWINLHPIVEQAVAQIRPAARAQSLDLIFAPENDHFLAYADGDRVAQIMLNLLSNAVRYTPSGGQIRIEMSHQSGPQKSRIHIAVMDTGIGIPPEALPHLFERFYRVDPSRTRSSGGSGIGLTISRHLAWAMNGELIAHSDGAGQGSTFTLILPGQ